MTFTVRKCSPVYKLVTTPVLPITPGVVCWGIAFECVLTFHFCEFARVQWGGEGVGVTSLAPDLYCLFDKQWKTQAVGCVFTLAQDVSISGPMNVISNGSIYQIQKQSPDLN